MGEVVNLDDYRKPARIWEIRGNDSLTVIFGPALNLLDPHDKAIVLELVCGNLLDEDPPPLIS